MKDRKLASRYARAMFDALQDPAAREKVDAFLNALGESIRQSPELRDFLLDPAVARADRKKLLSSIAERHAMPPETERFLHLVIEQGRAEVLPSIGQAYHEIYEESMGVVAAEITTAVPMSDEMKQRAQSALEKMTSKRVRLQCSIEPELIGGAVTRVGSTIYDGSLRTQLESLRRQMSEE